MVKWYNKLQEWLHQRKRAKYIKQFKAGFNWASEQRARGATLSELKEWTEKSDYFGVFNAFDDGVLNFIATVKRLERKPNRLVGVD